MGSRGLLRTGEEGHGLLLAAAAESGLQVGDRLLLQLAKWA